MNIPLEGITLSSGFLVLICSFFFLLIFFPFSISLSPIAMLATNAFQAEMLFGVEPQTLTDKKELVSHSSQKNFS